MSQRNITILDAHSTEDRRWDFAADVRAGLSTKPRSLPSRYFYDDRGSELFARIMRLQEYYPTHVETEIFREQGDRIVDAFGAGPLRLVDLGSGDGTKTEMLIERLQANVSDFRYCPVDISEAAVQQLLNRLAKEKPRVRCEGLVAEYVQALRYIRSERTDDGQGDTVVVTLLGSNIGNFDHSAALHFLAQIRSALSPGDLLLIGFDLKKDIRTLESAYDDAEGVTAEFNLNLLRRINREFGGDFDPEKFVHHSFYNPIRGSVDSYLVSLQKQTVRVRDLGIELDLFEWEPIHTEYSRKFRVDEVNAYARHSGFEAVQVFTDQRGWFVDALWRVV